MTTAILAQVATNMRTLVGTSNTSVASLAGYWREIALAVEELAAASTVANANLLGYMTRAAIAFEVLEGTDGSAENANYRGLMKRCVDAMEVGNGAVGTGSLENRLLLASADWSGGAPRVVFSGTIEEGATTGRAVGTATLANPPEDIGTLTWSELGTGTGAALFAIDGSTGAVTNTAAIDYDVATGGATSYTYGIQVTDGVYTYERLATISVTNVFEAASLSALGFSGTLSQNASSTVNITSATTGSTLSVLSGSLPAGTSLNSGARTVTGTPTTLGTGSATIRETLADSANSPRDTVWNWEVVDYVTPAITKGAVEGCSFDDAASEPSEASLIALSITADNLAVAGSGYAAMTGRLGDLTTAAADLLLAGGSGPNDLAYMTATAYMDLADTYMAAAKAELTNGQLLIALGIPPIKESLSGDYTGYNVKRRAVNAAMRARVGNGVVDAYIPRYEHPTSAYDGAALDTALMSDGIHPGGQMVTDGTACVTAALTAIVAQEGLAPSSTPAAYTIPAVTSADISTMCSSRWVVTGLGVGQTATVSVVSGGAYIARGYETDETTHHATASTSFTVMCGDTITVSKESSASYETEVTAVISVGGVERTFSITTAAESGVIASDTFPGSAGSLGTTEVGGLTWHGPAQQDGSGKLVLGQNNGAWGAFDAGVQDVDVTWTGVDINSTSGYRMWLLVGGNRTGTNTAIGSAFGRYYTISLADGVIYMHYESNGVNYSCKTFTAQSTGVYDVRVICKNSDNTFQLWINGSPMTLSNGDVSFAAFPLQGYYVGVHEENIANTSNVLDAISVQAPA